MAKTLTTQPPAPVPVAEPTIRDLYGLSATAHPNQPDEGMLPSDFLSLLHPGVRRYLRLKLEGSSAYMEADIWLERRSNSIWTCEKSPCQLDTWCRSAFHGSPARPRVMVSPVSYSQMAATSPLGDVSMLWASFEVELDRQGQGKKPFPSIVAASRDRVLRTLDEFEIQPWGLLDAGDEIVAFWRLHELINFEYAAIVVNKLAVVTGARRLPITSHGPSRSIGENMRIRGHLETADTMRANVLKDEYRRALTATWFPLVGQRAAVMPRHTVDLAILGQMTASAKVEDIARWVMPL